MHKNVGGHCRWLAITFQVPTLWVWLSQHLVLSGTSRARLPRELITSVLLTSSVLRKAAALCTARKSLPESQHFSSIGIIIKTGKKYFPLHSKTLFFLIWGNGEVVLKHLKCTLVDY